MRDGDADELLLFEHVRVLNVSSGAMRCLIGDKRVWLPREHINGTLRCRGDSGRLLVRRWVALDRKLALPSRVVRMTCQSLRTRRPSPMLRLVRPAPV
jgi:hypothetical protein